MVFVEVLKQPAGDTTKNTLYSEYILPTEDLERAIPAFFKTRSANVHAVIVCSDCRNEPISEEAFLAALRENNSPCIGLPNDVPKKGPCHYYVYSTDKPASVGAAIIHILEQAHFCYGDIDDADSLAGQIAGEEEDNKTDWESIWTQQLARMLSREIKTTRKLVLDKKSMHTLFLLLCLPEKHFEVFRKSKFFPSYVEYVVKGVDAGNHEEIERARLRNTASNKKKELDQIGTASTNSIVIAEEMEEEIASRFGKDGIQDLARRIVQFAAIVDSLSNMEINDNDWSLLSEVRNLLYSVPSGTTMGDYQQYMSGRVKGKTQRHPTMRE